MHVLLKHRDQKPKDSTKDQVSQEQCITSNGIPETMMTLECSLVNPIGHVLRFSEVFSVPVSSGILFKIFAWTSVACVTLGMSHKHG